MIITGSQALYGCYHGALAPAAHRYLMETQLLGSSYGNDGCDEVFLFNIRNRLAATKCRE